MSEPRMICISCRSFSDEKNLPLRCSGTTYPHTWKSVAGEDFSKDETMPKTKNAMFEAFAALLKNCEDIMQRKNSDYSGEDPFLNFNQIEVITKGKISREQGVLVRMTDKLSRVQRLLNNEAQVKDEKIEDTLIDLANYSLLLILLRRDKASRTKS